MSTTEPTRYFVKPGWGYLVQTGAGLVFHRVPKSDLLGMLVIKVERLSRPQDSYTHQGRDVAGRMIFFRTDGARAVREDEK